MLLRRDKRNISRMRKQCVPGPLPAFGGIRKIMDTYRRLCTYTNRVHSCHVVDRSEMAVTAALYAVQKVGKAGSVLKPEQLQAVCHMYEGRDVFLWLPTGFGKSIYYEVLPFVFDLKLESENSIVIVVSPLVSLIVDQVASLRSREV